MFSNTFRWAGHRPRWEHVGQHRGFPERASNEEPKVTPEPEEDMPSGSSIPEKVTTFLLEVLCSGTLNLT